MISVLIPVFNVNVYSLVQELSKQLVRLQIEAEILVYDDCSSPEYLSQNSGIIKIQNVFYKELDKNVGRVAIRNLLAQDARFEWLLFIDSDSVILNGEYLSNYLAAIDSQKYDVYTGGRIYQAEEPVDCSKRLHWRYGTKRESIKGAKNTLHTNNFCIRKTDFLELNFPPQIYGYGHEDTWLEITLKSKQKQIGFIENPILHAALEDAKVFLEKTKSALENLLVLPELFGEETVEDKIKLYRLFRRINKPGLRPIVTGLLNSRISSIEQNLNSCNPSLFNFDCYRLYHLLKLSQTSSHK